MFVRVNAIFNTWGAILHEGRIGGLINPIIVDFKKSDIQGILFHLLPAKTRFQPYFPSCLLFYRRVPEVSYNSCTFS